MDHSAVKREALSEHSLLVLNREITKEVDWGEDQIDARGRKLFEVAKYFVVLSRDFHFMIFTKDQ